MFDRGNHRSAGARLLVLAIALTAVAGLWGGLIRIGWNMPPAGKTPVQWHGPLMISGVFGTMIALERYIAVGNPRLRVLPFLPALGGISLLLGYDRAAALAFSAGSLVMALLFATYWVRDRALHTATMGIAALLWLVGNLLWVLRFPLQTSVFWWIYFLVLTIAGERLELGRILQPAREIRWLFTACIIVIVTGLGVLLLDYPLGLIVLGVGQVSLAIWLLWNDVSRKTIRAASLPRYIAVCLLLAYGWLGVSGVLALRFSTAMAGPLYDAILHSVLIGFVISMVFGHAPIILPSVLRSRFDFNAWLYLPLAVLHSSLVVRIAGDLIPVASLRRWGALFNALALLVFAGLSARSLNSRHAS